jgi:hypothetical protein
VFALIGSGARHHAVLVVGPHESAELFHWSYWRNKFVKGTYGPQPIYCNPRPNFLASLPSNAPPDLAPLSFYMAGMHFSIPNGYHPAPLWAYRFGLLISASPPLFRPTVRPWPSGEPGDTLVEVAFYQRQSLQTLLQAPDVNHIVEPAGTMHGLEKQIVHHVGSRGSQTQYLVRSPEGRVASVLQCFDRDCLHSFEYDGWTYEFHHSPSDIPRWREMEMQLVTLVRSFVQEETNNGKK